jgi:hypothetical protein
MLSDDCHWWNRVWREGIRTVLSLVVLLVLSLVLLLVLSLLVI